MIQHHLQQSNLRYQRTRWLYYRYLSKYWKSHSDWSPRMCRLMYLLYSAQLLSRSVAKLIQLRTFQCQHRLWMWNCRKANSKMHRYQTH